MHDKGAGVAGRVVGLRRRQAGLVERVLNLNAAEGAGFDGDRHFAGLGRSGLLSVL